MPIQDELDELEAELDGCEALRLHALGQMQEAAIRGLVYESIILRASRAHENFIEQVFLSYLTGDRTTEGNLVPAFASPRDRSHARRLLSSSASSRFLDWSESSDVRARCDVFFEPDSPIYNAVLLKSSDLAWMKKIRNQAAHDSVESRLAFTKVLEVVLLTLPQPLPTAGEFLQRTPRNGPIKNREVLAYFLDSLRTFAQIAAGKPTLGYSADRPSLMSARAG
ncbi:hypothetical protein [Arthrobacter sp. H35-D1]|uniref:hypothetical protein n=1 Tax=Arthrobacter sp. H35-D1 TaxID=3046202 RepID=UPI0024BAD76D|nr:hypothetical protein [Arthrobacter sp. H35-D1]MDJ0314498.1 hypothetical protein [Arthrobacter sp. H35-D1]